MVKIGNSIDIHPLAKGDYINIGGVEIPSHFTSVSYSDGDALLHCLTEAILGSLGKGDLGDNFPDTDPKYKDISSEYFLKEAKKMLEEENYHINNIDMMIVLESVKLKDYKKIVEHNIARILEIDSNKVNLKAGTNEKIASIGNDESYLCWASVIIEEGE